MTDLEIQEILKNSEFLHTLIEVLWWLIGVLILFGGGVITFLVRNAFLNNKTKVNSDIIVASYKDVIPDMKELYDNRLDKQDTKIKEQTEVIESIIAMMGEEFNYIKAQNTEIITMIQPMLNEYNSVDSLSKAMDVSKRDKLSQIHESDVDILEFIQLFKTSLIEFYKMITKTDISQMTCKEVEAMYETCANKVREFYPRLDESYLEISLPRLRARGYAYRDSIINIIKSKTNHVIDNLKQHTLMFFNDQINLVIITRAEWRGKVLATK